MTYGFLISQVNLLQMDCALSDLDWSSILVTDISCLKLDHSMIKCKLQFSSLDFYNGVTQF